MKTYFDCIPCLIRQALAAVRLVTPDEQIHEQILRETLQATSRMDMNLPPAAMSQTVHRWIRASCQNADPYRASKDQFNQLALRLLPAFRQHVEQAADPWYFLLRVKCPVIARDIGCPVGKMVLRRSPAHEIDRSEGRGP